MPLPQLIWLLKSFYSTRVLPTCHEKQSSRVMHISRVPDQNGVSQAWYIVEIHHSSQTPSMCAYLRVERSSKTISSEENYSSGSLPQHMINFFLLLLHLTLTAWRERGGCGGTLHTGDTSLFFFFSIPLCRCSQLVFRDGVRVNTRTVYLMLAMLCLFCC